MISLLKMERLGMTIILGVCVLRACQWFFRYCDSPSGIYSLSLTYKKLLKCNENCSLHVPLAKSFLVCAASLSVLLQSLIIIIYPPSLTYKKVLKCMRTALHMLPLSNYSWCGPLIFYCGLSFYYILSLSLYVIYFPSSSTKASEM